MTGRVDSQLRALFPLPLAASRDGPRQDVEAWVDTAFNGGLALPRPMVKALRLPQEASTDAVLADGRTVTVEMFGCHLDWFGGTCQTAAVASDAAYPLLGTQLLAGRRLVIDYAGDSRADVGGRHRHLPRGLRRRTLGLASGAACKTFMSRVTTMTASVSFIRW